MTYNYIVLENKLDEAKSKWIIIISEITFYNSTNSCIRSSSKNIALPYIIGAVNISFRVQPYNNKKTLKKVNTNKYIINWSTLKNSNKKLS